MRKITLNFKKEDFNSSYGDTRSCAITTALARAGYPDLQDCGIHIEKQFADGSVTDSSNSDYVSMRTTVLKMYHSSDIPMLDWLEPADFTAEILVNL